MAKYIIDVDSFKECLDFISEGSINGRQYAYIQNVKAFIERFPKQEVEEDIYIEAKIAVEPCEGSKS